MQASKSISIIPSDIHCILLAPSFQLHPVKSLDVAIPRAETGRLVAEQGSGTGAVSPAGCSRQNAKLNSIISGRHTAGVQSWVQWSHSEAGNTSPCLFQLAHKLERAGQWKTLAQSVFGRNQKVRISPKHHIQLLSIKEVLEACFTTMRLAKYPLITGLWSELRVRQVCAGMHLPALRSEGIAAQRIRSSSSKHCRAMRMATNVAKESWKDKSLTWKRGDQPVIQTASTSFPLSAIPRSWGAEGPITPGQCPWSAQAATNTNGSPWCSKPFPCPQKTKPPSLVHFCLLPRDPSTPASIPFPLLNACTCINIAEEIIEATGPIIGGTAQSFEHTQPLGT